MNAFVTGSQVYGKVTPDSDVDLVVRVDPCTAALLRKLSDRTMECQPVGTVRPVRFGNLNLILCETDEEWAVWKVGTSRMQNDIVRYDKRQAKAVFDELRSMLNLIDKADSGLK